MQKQNLITYNYILFYDIVSQEAGPPHNVVVFMKEICLS